ncbi:MAG TPA: WD40 repeat domain-containing protein, partial [Methylomirabilota bacterium]|nr:WD40 repeat domain-containing protein [Methylomirabilota bacterium]
AGEVLLWRIPPPRRRREPVAVPDHVRDTSFAPDGQTLAAWHWDGTISLRNIADPSSSQSLPELGSNNYGALFSPITGRLAVGTRQGAVRLWDAQTARETAILPGHEPCRMLPVAFSKDERVLLGVARLTREQRCYLWELNSGKQLANWAIGPINHRVALSHDGRHVATGDWDGTVRLWDATTGRELKRLGPHRTEVVGVEFAPDVQTLASGSTYGDVILWDLKTFEPRATLRGQSGAIYSLAFSPDGHRLVTGGNWQHAVEVWDPAIGQIVATLAGPGALHGAVRFASNGHALATVNNAGTLTLWQAPSFGTIEAASDR